MNARILDYIGAVRDERGEFYLKDLLKPLAEMFEKTEAEILDQLLQLQDKGMIVPVSIQTILQRQGMGLSNGDSEGITIPLPPELMEEIEKTTEEQEAIEEETLEYDEIVEPEEPEKTKEPEVSEEPKEPETKKKEQPKAKKMVDPLEEFVKDVEDLLTKEKEKDE